MNFLVIAASALMIFISGCVQMPTESQGAVDMRPRIGFKTNESLKVSLDARVYIDSLDAGPLAAYKNGVGMLAVLPGTHVVQVIDGRVVLLDEQVFLSDGAQRHLVINGAGVP